MMLEGQSDKMHTLLGEPIRYSLSLSGELLAACR